MQSYTAYGVVVIPLDLEAYIPLLNMFKAVEVNDFYVIIYFLNVFYEI